MRTDNNSTSRYTRMTTEKVSTLILSLAVPTIMSMLVTALYNMADTFYVGKINTSATGAVGIVFSLMTIIQVAGMMLGVGSGSYTARLLGQNNVSRAAKAASSAFFMALLWGTLLAIFGRLFLGSLMKLLGSTDTILPYAKAYAGYILLGAPYMAASFVLNINLRSEGNALLAMIGIVSGAVLNILLDPLFIFVFRLGIAGAALATILSQMVSFLILLSHYLRGRSSLKIHPRNIALETALYGEILRSGTPTLIRQSMAIFSTIVLNFAAGTFGDAAVAGMSVVNRIMLFMISLIIGFGQGFQPVAAFNYAAGRHTRVYEAFRFAVKTGTAVLIVYALITGIFAPGVVKLFRNDPAVIAVGQLALRLRCITLPLYAFIVMTNMMFQYIGKPAKAALLALCQQGMAFIPTLLLFSYLFGLKGIQMSQAVADVLTFMIAVPLALGALKFLKKGEPIPGKNLPQEK